MNVGGATAPVRILSGLAPQLWVEFGENRTLGEASARIAEQSGTAVDDVLSRALELATALIELDLAERA